MPGIYSRDNFAQLLAAAIENAQARRQAFVDREAARTNSNMQAIGNFAKALGRTYETWGQSDEDKLAALQKEREEVVAKQKYEQQVAQRNAVNEYLNTLNGADKVPNDAKHMTPIGPTQAEIYSEAMRGYEPNRLLNSPGYANSVLGLLDDRDELNKRLDENYEPYKPRVSMRRGLY